MSAYKPESQCDRVLRVLRDGRPHTIAEIHARAGTMRLNSRVAELRKRYGLEIVCWRDRQTYVYQLLPQERLFDELLALERAV